LSGETFEGVVNGLMIVNCNHWRGWEPFHINLFPLTMLRTGSMEVDVAKERILNFILSQIDCLRLRLKKWFYTFLQTIRPF